MKRLVLEDHLFAGTDLLERVRIQLSDQSASNKEMRQAAHAVAAAGGRHGTGLTVK